MMVVVVEVVVMMMLVTLISNSADDNVMMIIHSFIQTRGDNLWGDGPPKFEVGDGPCIRLPNILRNSVCRMTVKKILLPKWKKGVFLARKGLCTISNKVKIRKIREKRGKIRSSEIFAAKMEICSEKSHLGPRKFFPSPQTRRQVSSTDSDHFCSASSSPLLLRSAPDAARILCRSFTPKTHRQLGELRTCPRSLRGG